MNELESLAALTNYRVKKCLLDLISRKQTIDKKLQDENLSVQEEMDLKNAKYLISQQIQQIRFSGIL